MLEFTDKYFKSDMTVLHIFNYLRRDIKDNSLKNPNKNLKHPNKSYNVWNETNWLRITVD